MDSHRGRLKKRRANAGPSGANVGRRSVGRPVVPPRRSDGERSRRSTPAAAPPIRKATLWS